MRFTAIIAMLLAVPLGTAEGQSRMQFPPQYGAAPAPATAPSFGAPWTAAPALPANPGAYLGSTIQPLDPYALPSNLDGVPGLGVPNFGATPNFGAPNFGAPNFGSPNAITPPGGLSGPNWLPPGELAPGSMTPPPGIGSPGFGAPYGTPTPRTGPLNPAPLGSATANDPYFRGSPYSTPYGSSAQAYSYSGTGYGNQANGYGNPPPYQRLFQDTGLRATYLHGSRADDLQMTEVEASTTAYLANFLGVPNGLRVTPGFAFHWTDGPQGAAFPDVPGRLYSGYLDFGFAPQFNPRLSAELSARVGIYTDFEAFNEDSIRLLGTAVGVYQTTPTVALKLGAAYIDRVRVKLLPAGGILWTPNPQTRWDIFFPAPKLSNYWTTIGNQQVWWYIGGEYGGGSWSIERVDQPPRNDRIDINDIRFYAGVEWWNVNRYYGFLELGYVFDREVVFYRQPGDSENLDDTFMVRGGVSW